MLNVKFKDYEVATIGIGKRVLRLMKLQFVLVNLVFDSKLVSHP